MKKNCEEIEMETALELLFLALKLGGAPIYVWWISETDYGDRLVKVRLTGGKERVANITADSIPTAIWDIMKQIPELRERG